MERQAAIRDFCKKKNRTGERVDTKNQAYIIVAEKFKTLFCYVPKVACTEWKTVMTRLRVTEDQWKPIIEALNRGDRESIHDHRNIRFLNSYPRDEAERMLKTYFKFVFVREPFERFLSAYLNKFQTWNDYYYQHFGRYIIKQYRPGHPNDKNVTFDEFVQYVINSRGPGWDPHWQTYDRLCHPCAIHYDFIGKFENLDEEARHVLEISNISRKLNVSFPHVRPSSTSLKIPLYFSQIPKERLSRIVRSYTGDSEMFQYDWPKFLRERMTDADKLKVWTSLKRSDAYHDINLQSKWKH